MFKSLCKLAVLTLLGATACGQDDQGACVITTDRGNWCVINETRRNCGDNEFTKAESEAAAQHCNQQGFTEADHAAKDPKSGGVVRLDGKGYILVADPREVRKAVERGYQVTFRVPEPKTKK